MHIPRIYSARKLVTEQELELGQNATNHLLHVLRLKLNDQLTIFNGQGGEYSATLISVKKQKVVVRLNEFIDRNTDSPLTIQLAQAISRSEKMDYIVQKAVELGVQRIVPIISHRCTVKLAVEKREKRQQRWQTIAINACEQSGRTSIPQVEVPRLFGDWLTEPCFGIKLVMDPQGEKRLTNLEFETPKVTVLIGPEGGLTREEIVLAQQKNFSGLSFGPRILRTETAAVAILSALQTKWGDLA